MSWLQTRAIRLFALAVLACVLHGGSASAAGPAPREAGNVLFLYSYGHGSKDIAILDEGISEGMAAGGVKTNQLFFEHLDLGRHSGDASYASELRQWILRKYAGRRIDVIVTVQQPALRFLLEELGDLAPGVPVVTVQAPPPSGAEAGSRRFLCEVTEFDVQGTLERAMELLPETRRIVVVSGDSVADRRVAVAAAGVAARWKPRVEFETTSDLSLEQMLDRVAALPPHSIILFTQFNRDPSGKVTVAYEVEGMITRVANAPVFGLHDFNLVNRGIGGSVVSVEGLGRATAQAALDLLDGKRQLVQPVTIATTQAVPIFDWKQIERWKGDPSRLPAGSTFLHRTPGIMERYGAYVGAAVLALILQSLLIAALFVQRARRARAEEAVRKTEGLFRGLFETHAAVKLIIDPATGSIVDANQAAANYYGWSRERLRQMRIQDINTLSPEEAEQEIQKARTLERVHFEFRHRRADGSIADVDVFSSKVDIQGKELLHSIVHDSTARKRAEEGLRESEERYRSVVTSMTEGVVVRNAACLVITCNPAAEEIFGVAAHEMKDHIPPNPGLHVIREDGSPFAAEEYPPMVALRTGQPQVNVVMGFHHPGGRVTWTKSNSELLRDPGGRVEGVVTTIADITERRALREQLTVASRLAAMGTLVAGVAHEINNPLAGEMASQEMAIREVKGFAELLRRGDPLDRETLASRVDEVIEMLGDAQVGSRRIAAIVKDLSVFGRSDRTRSPVQLSAIVESAMRRLPPAARTAASIRVEAGPAPEVLASEGQLEQVVENLVTNAALALPAGRQGEITVRTGPGRPGMARLDVTDNGIGIAPELVDRIFDPFFSTRDVGKGMGLGLSISHAIVAAHGGTLTVASVAGMGSTFRMELPAAGTP